MAEDNDPLAGSGAQISRRGILITMSVLVALGTLVGLIAGGTSFGVGIAFGGLLGFANYWWLDRVTKAIFVPDAAATAGVLAARYILRYVVIGAVLFGVYWTGVMPVAAVIAGLACFAAAVVIQGLIAIFISST